MKVRIHCRACTGSPGSMVPTPPLNGMISLREAQEAVKRSAQAGVYLQS